MAAKFYSFIVFWGIVSILLDCYIYIALKQVLSGNLLAKKIVLFTYLSFAAINFLIIASGFFVDINTINKGFRNAIMMYFVGFLLFKFLFSFFLFVGDAIRLGQWIVGRFFTNNQDSIHPFSISRFKFFTLITASLSLIPSAALVYGAVFNPYNYRFKRTTITFDNLPEAFENSKWIHISDIHSGSFTQKQPLIDVVNKINEERADGIFFTGDLVNTYASEVEPYIDIFKELKATHGVFSSLGNHDYGDYSFWKTKEAKVENFNKLIENHALMGWKLLKNEHAIIEKNNQKIGIVGVENWSSHLRFPKHGDMEKSKMGMPEVPFKILMSHDPSHWEAQILKNHNDIDLMLSGHTHGFQFGIEIPGFIKWSPSQYIYKQWAGLYNQGKQYLYVNRGFGFLGYPGRVGILPEITVLTLTNKS
jgi:predicted MPP superfamily phosphohydrolase